MAITIDGAGTITGLDADGISSQPVFPGQVLQVVQVVRTNPISASVSANTFNEFDSGFRLNITPSASVSKILLSAHITGSQNAGSVRYKFQFSTDGGSSFNDVAPIGDANGSRSRGHFVFPINGDFNQAETTSMELLHAPNTSSPIIYRVQFGQDVSTTYHFNRSINYSNNFLGGTYVSVMLAKEIA